MKGARRYANLFNKSIQVGRLYILPHYHARGKTFRIYVLPEGENVIENAGINPPLNIDSVEVYGVIGGNPGWTEYYGWLYEGLWQDDFNSLVAERILLEDRAKSADEFRYFSAMNKKEDRIKRLLANY